MFDTVGLLFKTASVLAQVEAAADDSTAQYVVIGIVSAIILVLIVQGLKSSPIFDASAHVSRPEEPNAGRSAAQIEAEARRAF